jgi:hypothetical protein
MRKRLSITHAKPHESILVNFQRTKERGELGWE